MHNKAQLIEFTRKLAEDSGELIRQHWQRSDIAVSTKADKTVVTETDQAVERMMREQIKAAFPEHGIIGEEYGNENENAEYVWVLDPIDGTISYVHGVPLFGSLFGLLHNGQPIIGCIHQPILRQLMIGDGDVTTLNGKPVNVSDVDEIADAELLTTDPRRPHQHFDGAKFDSLCDEAKLLRSWGDCYGYLMVACGRADAMLDPILNLWDLLPLIPVIRGAGGIITDWEGNDPVNGSSAIVANPILHAQLLEYLN